MDNNNTATSVDETSLEASQILDDFFQNSEKIEGIDPDVAKIVKKLWLTRKLSRDELLSALEQVRSSGAS